MPNLELRIDAKRLLARIDALAEIGAIDGGGVCRMALTEEDRQGRECVLNWMHDLGLEVASDAIGNVVAVRPGRKGGNPVTTGSHLDTVATGGRYDGALGVLAGLEVVETLRDNGIETTHPVAVAFFTNEEGARFAPDMMGSMVQQGHIPLEVALESRDRDGKSVRESLPDVVQTIEKNSGDFRARAFLELHVEQGPVLEREGYSVAAVTGVQGISWSEIAIEGVANHAGTTPMALRSDAAFAAASVATFVRDMARDMGGTQVATVGKVDLTPNLVNVIAKRALMTVDLRNTLEEKLSEAEKRLQTYLEQLSRDEGVKISRRSLARFQPVDFDPAVIDRVVGAAEALDLSVKRMPSGAGHDAQAFAPNCPTGMIFVPSVDGISHNVREYTRPEDIEHGANVLLRVMLQLAE